MVHLFYKGRLDAPVICSNISRHVQKMRLSCVADGLVFAEIGRWAILAVEKVQRAEGIYIQVVNNQ